jgi:hypothetical protein
MKSILLNVNTKDHNVKFKCILLFLTFSRFGYPFINIFIEHHVINKLLVCKIKIGIYKTAMY